MRSCMLGGANLSWPGLRHLQVCANLSLFLLIQVEKARGHYENLMLSSACEAVLEIGNAGNSYMDERAPWSLFKKGGDDAETAAKVSLSYSFDKYLLLGVIEVRCLACLKIRGGICRNVFE